MSKKAKNQPSAESRESFIPKSESLPPPEVFEASGPAETKPEDRISITLDRENERSIRLTLSIPPLRPCIQNTPVPLQASPEQQASRIASAIARAAEEAAADGIYQHAEKKRIEEESRARYNNR